MSINKFTKFSLTSFTIWIIPFLISGSGFDVINNDAVEDILRIVYTPFGWTDMGSPIFLLISIILSMIALKQKHKSKFDLIINIIILLPGIFLFLTFCYILFVMFLFL